MWILKNGLYLRVLIPRKGKEGRRGSIQVIRGIPHGKHIWKGVPWIYHGTLHSRHVCRNTPSRIVHSRQIVLERYIWDVEWTGEGYQERQEQITSRNSLGPLRQNSKSCTHATGLILQLHNDASNSYRCRYHHYIVSRVLREKRSIRFIWPYEIDFWWLVSG